MVWHVVMDALGGIPEESDRFEWEVHFFEGVSMEGLRVDKVLVAPVMKAAECRKTDVTVRPAKILLDLLGKAA